MSERKDGGPAFPLPHEDGCVEADDKGMSLRDYFAAKAMQGEIAASGAAPRRPYGEEIAGYAYAVADAMLAERKRK